MANTPKNKRYPERIDGPKFGAFLLKEKVVKLAGVGTFHLRVKKPYMGYSTTEKKRALISGDARVSFRPERALKEIIKNVKKPAKKTTAKVARRAA